MYDLKLFAVFFFLRNASEKAQCNNEDKGMDEYISFNMT